MPVSSWSTTASANATADAASGISVPEGMPPSGVNDAIRALMAVIKGDFANSFSQSGYQKFPNGLIIQWTTFQVGVADTFGTWTFPVAFPSSGANTVVITDCVSGVASSRVFSWHNSASNTSVQIAANAATFIHAIAIGY